MNVLNKKLDKKTVFNLTNNAEHIMAVKGEGVEVKGVTFGTAVDADGVEQEVAYVLNDEKAYFCGAASVVNALKSAVTVFRDEIEKGSITCVFDQRETGKGRTIWFVEVV